MQVREYLFSIFLLPNEWNKKRQRTRKKKKKTRVILSLFLHGTRAKPSFTEVCSDFLPTVSERGYNSFSSSPPPFQSHYIHKFTMQSTRLSLTQPVTVTDIADCVRFSSLHFFLGIPSASSQFSPRLFRFHIQHSLNLETNRCTTFFRAHLRTLPPTRPARACRNGLHRELSPTGLNELSPFLIAIDRGDAFNDIEFLRLRAYNRYSYSRARLHTASTWCTVDSRCIPVTIECPTKGHWSHRLLSNLHLVRRERKPFSQRLSRFKRSNLSAICNYHRAQLRNL